MNALAPSFLIGSSSYLQVTRTYITSRTSSKLGQIGPMTAALAALGRLKKKSPYILKAKSNFTLFIFKYIYTRSDFKQMEHCH